ncbi:MAG: hypothetical protein HHJ10_10450, partial [Cellulomonas sp.]|uniref:transporter associated domain-containing protein n=1 Tax=Cellulomonas sp. TaxID=40001 RepID=UPI0017E84536
GLVPPPHDRRRSTVTRRADGSWALPGLLRPDELTEATGLSVPEDGPYETLGGLVMALLGRVPEVGDEVVAGDVRLRVEAMQGRRVERVAVAPVDEGETPDDDRSPDGGGHR